MATFGSSGSAVAAPAPTRGTLKYDPNTGYAGAAYSDPNAWASDADFNAYQAAQTAPKAGATSNYVDTQGMSHPYSSAPNVMTDLYGLAPQPGGATGSVAGLNTAVTGKGTLSQGAYEGEQQSMLNAELQKEAEARRLGYLSTVTGQQAPHVGAQGGPAFDENAARTAAFARAKEQAGQSALASVKALSDVMGERGLTGSSVEGNAMGEVIGGGASRINNYTRDQLGLDLNRAADIADNNQHNAIVQRGQDLSLIPSLMGLITRTGGAY